MSPVVQSSEFKVQSPTPIISSWKETFELSTLNFFIALHLPELSYFVLRTSCPVVQILTSIIFELEGNFRTFNFELFYCVYLSRELSHFVPRTSYFALPLNIFHIVVMIISVSSTIQKCFIYEKTCHYNFSGSCGFLTLRAGGCGLVSFP